MNSCLFNRSKRIRCPRKDDRIADWRTASQGLPAVRDFNPAYVSCGSFASHNGQQDFATCPLCLQCRRALIGWDYLEPSEGLVISLKRGDSGWRLPFWAPSTGRLGLDENRMPAF